MKLKLIVALVAIPILLSLSIPIMYLQSEPSVAIYHSFLAPASMVALINKQYALAVSTNMLEVINPVTGARYFKYSIYGVPQILATDYMYSPSVIAIATGNGEIIALRRSGYTFSITSFRFHGSLKVARLYVTSSTLYALTIEGALRRLIVMNLSSSSWCEAGVPPSNMVPTSANYIKVLDFINAYTRSSQGLATTPILLLVYSRLPRIPPNSTIVSVVVMVNNATVPNAIVEIKYGTVTQFQYTDRHGKAQFYVPINVSSLSIQAFYANRTSGTTYYAKQVLEGPLSKNASYTIVLHLKPSIVAVPRVVSTVFLSIYRIPIANCQRYFSKPLATIPLNVSNPNQIKLLNAYVAGDKLIVAYSSLTPTYIGDLWTIDVITVNLTRGSILWKGVYYVPSPATYAAFSNDGHLIAVTTESNIMYVLWSPYFQHFSIVDSYKLPAQPTSIEIAKESYGYLVLVGCKNGAFLALTYVSGGVLLPVNRGPSLYLQLSPPTYISADPNASSVAVATYRGVYLITNLGPSALGLIGRDLSRFITRNVMVLVSGSAGGATISLGSPRVLTVKGSKAVFKNVPTGEHTLVIVPSNPYAPRAIMKLDIGTQNVNATISFLNPFDNKSLYVTVFQILKNQTKILASNVKNFSVSIPYGAKALYRVSFSDITVDGYSLPVYTNASISIAASEDSIEIQLSAPSWRRASQVQLCLFTPRGTAVTNASVAIVGYVTKYSTELALNPKTGCFEAFNVPYDLYNVTFVSLPPNLQAPGGIKLVVAQPTIVSRQTLLYKPLTLTLLFSEPPKVPLDVYVAGKHVRVDAGIKQVTIKGIYPGTYTLTVKPIPALRTFNGKIAVPYYYPVSRRITLTTNATVSIDLKPKYIYVAIDVRDQINRKSGPLQPVRLEINGINIAVLTERNHVVAGYIPIDTKTVITLVPTSQVYKKVVKVVEPSKLHLRNGTSLTIYVPRQKFKVSIIVMSSLGNKVQGALVIPTCNTITPSPSITDSSGRVTFYVPALSNCMIKVLKEGYYSVTKSVFVGTTNVYETITLKAKPITVLMHYMNVLTAAIVVGSVIGIMLYLKKRIEAKLESTVEEII